MSATRPITLPCDPEGYNDRRAELAHIAIVAYAQEAHPSTGDRQDLDMVLRNLLCNLRHWADRNMVPYDLRHSAATLMYADETACEEAQ